VLLRAAEARAIEAGVGWISLSVERALPGTPDTADPRITDAGQGKDS
jgi:hypothetical protein